MLQRLEYHSELPRIAAHYIYTYDSWATASLKPSGNFRSACRHTNLRELRNGRFCFNAMFENNLFFTAQNKCNGGLIVNSIFLTFAVCFSLLQG